jgi:hypothetical protein
MTTQLLNNGFRNIIQSWLQEAMSKIHFDNPWRVSRKFRISSTLSAVSPQGSVAFCDVTDSLLSLTLNIIPFYPPVTDTPFVVTELESAQQLQADQLYLSVPSGSLLVPERGPYTQLQEHLNSQGLPQYIPFGNPPSQITSYTGSDALFPLWSRESLTQPSFRNQSWKKTDALILIVALKMKQTMTKHFCSERHPGSEHSNRLTPEPSSHIHSFDSIGDCCWTCFSSS